MRSNIFRSVLNSKIPTLFILGHLLLSSEPLYADWSSWSVYSYSGNCHLSFDDGNIRKQRFVRTRTCVKEPCVGPQIEKVLRECKKVKIMTHNIHHGFDRNNKTVNGESLYALLDYIRDEKIDVAMLQEVSNKGHDWQLFNFPGRYGKQPRFFNSRLPGYQLHFEPIRTWSTILYGKTHQNEHGLMNLVNAPEDQVEFLPEYIFKRNNIYREGDKFNTKRKVISFKLKIPGYQQIIFMNTHLDVHSKSKRYDQIVELMKLQSTYSGKKLPVVLSGDMNILSRNANNLADANPYQKGDWRSQYNLKYAETGSEAKATEHANSYYRNLKEGYDRLSYMQNEWGFPRALYRCNSRGQVWGGRMYLFVRRVKCDDIDNIIMKVRTEEGFMVQASDHKAKYVTIFLRPLNP